MINWTFPDISERHTLTLENSALTYVADKHADLADATVTLDRSVFSQIVMGRISLTEALAQRLLAVDGMEARLMELFDLLDSFQLMFPVVEPIAGD